MTIRPLNEWLKLLKLNRGCWSSMNWNSLLDDADFWFVNQSEAQELFPEGSVTLLLRVVPFSSPENALDVVVMIESLLRDHSTLSYQELVTVLNKLKDIISLSVVTPHLGQGLVNILSDILESDSDLLPFTNTWGWKTKTKDPNEGTSLCYISSHSVFLSRILNITEAVGERMVGYEGCSTLVAPAIAISVVDVVPKDFDSLTFGVSSDRAGKKPEVNNVTTTNTSLQSVHRLPGYTN